MLIAALANHFAQKFDVQLTSSFLQTLEKQDWPGNVRELENIVQRFRFLGEEAIVPSAKALDGFGFDGQLKTLREIETDYIRHVLDVCDGNKTRAAEILGIDASTLHRREKAM